MTAKEVLDNGWVGGHDSGGRDEIASSTNVLEMMKEFAASGGRRLSASVIRLKVAYARKTQAHANEGFIH